MNAREVCEELGIPPDVLASMIRTYVAHRLRVAAAAVEQEKEPVLGNVEHDLLIASLLDEEWDRQHPEDEYMPVSEEEAQLRRQLWALDGVKEGGDDAKEATSTVAAARSEGSRPEPS